MSFERLAIGTTILGGGLVYLIGSYSQPTVTFADSSTLLILFALYAFTEFFPLKRHQITISLSISVDLLVFVKFGLLPVVLMSQFLIFISRWQLEKKLELWKIVANCGMYLTIASVSAGVFYLTGGTHTDPLPENLLPLAAYVVAHFAVNHLLLFMLLRSMTRLKLRAFLTELRLDVFSTLFAGSIGFLVILLYESDGLYGLLAIGFPMILCAYVFKLFNDVWRSSALFRNLAALTGQFTGELDVTAMTERVTEEVPRWFDHTHCLIFAGNADGTVRPLSVSLGCPEEASGGLQHFLQRTAAGFETLRLHKRLLEEPEFAACSYRALLIEPFKLDNGTWGYCCLLSEKANNFDATIMDAISILAHQLSVSSEIAARYESVEKQSLYDELTQLPNHRFLERRLEEEIERLRDTAPLSLLLIDLDHFKQINDCYGHLAGNTVLHTVARTFEQCLRKNDFVSRYGGEEFLVVLPGATTETALAIGEKIRSAVEARHITVSTMEGESKTISLTVSIGVASIPDDATDSHQLLRFADRAMYYGAKRAGRNRVAAYRKDAEE